MNMITGKSPVPNLLDEYNFEVMSKVPAYFRKGIKVDHADTEISIHKGSAKQQPAGRAA